MTDQDDAAAQHALNAFQAAAASRGAWTTHDPVVRYAYRTVIARMSERIWAQDKAGRLSAQEAAAAAQEERTFILDITRLVST